MQREDLPFQHVRSRDPTLIGDRPEAKELDSGCRRKELLLAQPTTCLGSIQRLEPFQGSKPLALVRSGSEEPTDRGSGA